MAQQFSRLRKIYQSLSDNQRNNFWVAATNIFLVIFTFWLGLTVQYIVVDSNSKVNSQLVKLEYYQNVSTDYASLIKQVNLLLNSDLATKLDNTDSNKNLNTYFNLYNNKFIEITKITDTTIVLANRLAWIISDNKTEKKLNKSILQATVYNGLLKICVEKPKIQDVETLMSEYFESDFFINQTHTVTTDDFRQAASLTVKDLIKKQPNELLCVNILNKIVESVTSIFTILHSELGNRPNNTLQKITRFWDDIPTIAKSTILLFILLAIGYLISNQLLQKMNLPSQNNKYTRENFERLSKEKNDSDSRERDTKNRETQLLSIIDLQREQIHEYEKKIDEKEDKYVALLYELGEKNEIISQYKHNEEQNKTSKEA